MSVVAGARRAVALDACSAADITNQEATCPPHGVCTITKRYVVADECTLDFSDRDVVLAPASVLTIGQGSVMIRARNLTLAANSSVGAFIDGRGAGTTRPNNDGGNLTIEATGTVTVEKTGNTRAHIEVSGTEDVGSISIHAGETVTIAGRLEAAALPGPGSTYYGDSGSIDIQAGKDIISLSDSQIFATGRVDVVDGGYIALDAGGRIDLGDILNVTGSRGGSVTLSSGGDVTVRGVTGNATTVGDNSAGDLDICAAGDVRFLDNPIYLNGDDTVAAGGNGGAVRIEAPNGSVHFEVPVHVIGPGSQSGGGRLEVDAGADITSTRGSRILATSGRLSGEGSGYVDLHAEGKIDLGDLIDVSGIEGGGVTLSAGTDLIVRGISANGIGGGAGGDVELLSGGDMQILANPIAVNGGTYGGGYYNYGGSAGTLAIQVARGNLIISSSIRADAGSPEGEAGETTLFVNGSIEVTGGIISIRGATGPESTGGHLLMEATKSITLAGRIIANAAAGRGYIQIAGWSDVTVNGTIEAVGFAANGDGGSVAIQSRLGSLHLAGTIDVSAGPCKAFPLECPRGGSVLLESCGLELKRSGQILNGSPGEGGENILSAGGALQIDGYVTARHVGSSSLARDGRNRFLLPPGTVPAMGPAAVVQPAPLLQPGGRQSCGVCGDGSVAAPEQCDDGNNQDCDGCSSLCRFESCTAGSCSPPCDVILDCYPFEPCAAEPTIAPTSTASRPPTPTPTPPPVAAASATATVPTSLPTLSICPGDCDGDGQLTVNEIVIVVNIAAGVRDLSVCASADGNGDKQITVDEIVAAVAKGLNGC